MQVSKIILPLPYHISICIPIILKKTIYYTVNVKITKAELFAIRCKINQAINIPEVFHIIVITDAIHLAKHIFDSSILSIMINSNSLRSQRVFQQTCFEFNQILGLVK